ncbi:redoxin domain-containing protein [Nibrella viscosa]|uniref:redoxin domain-containing protein n=1 Tax=Nibrella viscosa TaxID=1084524 RepID=UPI0031F0E2D4
MLVVLFLLGSGQSFGSLSSVFHFCKKFDSGKNGVYIRGNSPATVIVFLDTECPISQKYTRRLAALHKRYAPAGIQFLSIYPSPTDNPKTIRRFHQVYNLPFTGRPDPRHYLVKQYKAHVTPEAVVVNQAGIVMYQGAIDDWFVDLGKYRREPTRHYLQEALDAVLTGQPILTASTKAVGCLISERVNE